MAIEVYPDSQLGDKSSLIDSMLLGENVCTPVSYTHLDVYKRQLLQCVHNPEKKEKLKPIAGSPPDLLKPPAGCPFVDRCPEAMKVCKLYMPEVTTYSATHQCACWLEEANRRKGENHG